MRALIQATRPYSYCRTCIPAAYQLQNGGVNGYFTRGALAIGPLCITDDIIYGTSLIESYQLESKAAIVPRVIVTEPIHRFVTEHIQSADKPTANDANDLLCHDIDGWWFVNYLNAAEEPSGVNWQLIEQHKASVMASLARSPRHDILPKFGWVSRYHNVFCHWHRNVPGYSDEFRRHSRGWMRNPPSHAWET